MWFRLTQRAQRLTERASNHDFRLTECAPANPDYCAPEPSLLQAATNKVPDIGLDIFEARSDSYQDIT